MADKRGVTVGDERISAGYRCISDHSGGPWPAELTLLAPGKERSHAAIVWDKRIQPKERT